MHIWKYRLYLLPLLIITTLFLEYTGILHVAYIHIKSHELKWTELAMDYFPREGDLFTSGEEVSQNNYEDALIAFRPDYDQMLKEDLAEIADNREQIDHIDKFNLSFYSGPYEIRACLDKKEIEIKDTTFFRKIVDVEILGNYELYNSANGQFLYAQPHQKFWIRDQIMIRGRSRHAFVQNKVDEIWIAQMSNNAHKIVKEYELPLHMPKSTATIHSEWTTALSEIALERVNTIFTTPPKDQTDDK